MLCADAPGRLRSTRIACPGMTTYEASWLMTQGGGGKDKGRRDTNKRFRFSILRFRACQRSKRGQQACQRSKRGQRLSTLVFDYRLQSIEDETQIVSMLYSVLQNIAHIGYSLCAIFYSTEYIEYARQIVSREWNMQDRGYNIAHRVQNRVYSTQGIEHLNLSITLCYCTQVIEYLSVFRGQKTRAHMHM